MDTLSPPPWEQERLARAVEPADRQSPLRRPRGRRLRDRSEPLVETVDQRPGRGGALRTRWAALLAALRKGLTG